MSARLQLAPVAATRSALALADAERQAVALAARHTVADRVAAVVYLVADRVQVLPATEPAPDGAAVHCVAERWDAGQVQVRRAGAWSDWVAAPLPGGAA
jgi:hypothetical protein